MPVSSPAGRELLQEAFETVLAAVKFNTGLVLAARCDLSPEPSFQILLCLKRERSKVSEERQGPRNVCLAFRFRGTEEQC